MKTQPKITKEKIEFESGFGPFQTIPIKLDILPLTVFIGPQGTGKSLISQLLYFFRDAEYLLAQLSEREDADDVVRRMVEGVRGGEKINKAFAPFLSKDVLMTYQCQYDNHSTLKRQLFFNKKDYKINPLQSFKQEIEEWLLRFVKPAAAGQVLNKALFVPAERTFFSHVINPAPHLLGNNALSFATREFINFLFTQAANIHQQWQKEPEQRPKEVNEIENLVKDALGGQAIFTQNGAYARKWQYVMNDNQQPIEIGMASSGQMDTWPLVSAVQAIFGIKRRPLLLHIEEPETHLHPKAQVALIKMLAYLVNQGFHIVITTHSLFVLYALNNLTLAYRQLSDQNAKNVPSPNVRLAPEKVAAYLFDNGTITNIVDDSGQIDEGLLGNVLGDLEVEFNRLMAYKILWGLKSGLNRHEKYH
jgi:predicted ATPase